MKLFILLVLLSPFTLFSQPQKIDSLSRLLVTEKEPAILLMLHNQLGIAYMTVGMFDSAHSSFNKALKYNGNVINKAEYVRSLSEIGNLLSVTGFQKNGLDSLLQASNYVVQIKEGNDRDNLEMRLHKYFGDLYGRSALFDKSIEHLQKSLTVANRLHDESQIAKNFSTLAINYSRLAQYEKAFDYNRKALSVFKKTNNSIGVGNVYSNMATAHKESGNVDSAAFYNGLAEKKHTELNYPPGISGVYSLNAELLNSKGDYNNALAAYRQVINFDSEIGMVNNLGYDYQAMGYIFQELKKTDSAIQYFKKSIAYFKEGDMQKELSNSYESLLRNYIIQANIDSIKKYNPLFINANEKYLDEEKINSVSNLEIKYETSLKEARIKTQQTEIKAQKQQNFWLITGGSIAALIAFGLALLYKRIKKQKQQIELQKKEIIHNNRNNIQQLISIFSRQAENSNLKESSIANQERLYTLNMLNKLLYEKGESNNANVKDYLQQIREAKQISTGSEVDIQVNTPSITLKSNLLKDIGLIINELTTNSIKHAFANTPNPLIKIDLKQQANNIIITLADNGSGLPQGFNFDNSRKSFGLDFVKDLSEQHHGSIIASNDNGARFEILLKI